MKLKIPSSIPHALRIGFCSCAILTVIFRSIAFLTSYQIDSNYFNIGAIFPILSSVFALLTALLGTVDAILFTSIQIDKKDRLQFAPLFAAAGFLISGIYFLLIAINTFEIITAILLLLSALYCVLDRIENKFLASVNIFLGFAAILACAALTGYHYFDQTVEMNAPIKVSLQVALLISMLFFTGELRCRMGIPMPRLYRILAAWTIASGAISSLPTILAFCLGKIDRIDYLVTAILVLGVTILALIRLVCMSFNHETPNEHPNTNQTDSII